MAKKKPLGIRFEDAEGEALGRAVKAEDRAMSALGRKIIVEWLRRHGWLPDAGRPISSSHLARRPAKPKRVGKRSDSEA